jgi:hypothetical protein
MDTHSKVRLATVRDEPEILNLLQAMWKESGWRPLDVNCARDIFARAFDRKGGILGVIGAPGHIRAMSYLLISRHWYTLDSHLEELFCWVHPDHRNTDYARVLMAFAKKCSDDMSGAMGKKVPLMTSVITNRQMEAKVRLYRRTYGVPVGALFLHNPDWANQREVMEEDIWRVPSVTKAFFKRQERLRLRDKRKEEHVNGTG